MCMRDKIPIEDFPSPQNRITPATLTVCDRYGLVKLTGENEDKSWQKKTHGGKRMKRPKVAHKNKMMCVNVFILSTMIIYMYVCTWRTNFWSITFLPMPGWKSGDSRKRKKNS